MVCIKQRVFLLHELILSQIAIVILKESLVFRNRLNHNQTNEREREVLKERSESRTSSNLNFEFLSDTNRRVHTIFLTVVVFAVFPANVA